MRRMAAIWRRGVVHLTGQQAIASDHRGCDLLPRDSHASYYTLSTRRAECGNGAIPMLIWEAIRRAARDGRVFDFDGLSNEGSIGLYAGFGGVTSPRFVSARSVRAGLWRKVRRGLELNTSTFGA